MGHPVCIADTDKLLKENLHVVGDKDTAMATVRSFNYMVSTAQRKQFHTYTTLYVGLPQSGRHATRKFGGCTCMRSGVLLSRYVGCDAAAGPTSTGAALQRGSSSRSSNWWSFVPTPVQCARTCSTVSEVVKWVQTDVLRDTLRNFDVTEYCLYMRCSELIDVIVITRSHIGGILRANKNRAKMQKSEILKQMLFADCFSTGV